VSAVGVGEQPGDHGGGKSRQQDRQGSAEGVGLGGWRGGHSEDLLPAPHDG
jgi:hypothetical protein